MSPSSPLSTSVWWVPITKQMKRFMKDVFLAYITRDARSLVHALSELGFIEEDANLPSIERAMSLLIERYHGMTLGEVSDLDIPEMVQDVEYLLYGQQIQIPAQFAFTGRAVGILAGVSTGLAPEFNFVEVATPYARKFLGLDARVRNKHSNNSSASCSTRAECGFRCRALWSRSCRLEAGQIEVKLGSLGSSGWIGLRRARRGRGTGGLSGLPGFSLALHVHCMAGPGVSSS